MKTGGGKNFSCFFNYFPKAKSWKAQSFSLRIAQMQKRICHDALFFTINYLQHCIEFSLLNRHRAN